jgi:predicted Zn finger-like uncharacterized protein
MSLTTRCPQCGTAFKVVSDQLRIRRGLVRCGVCATVFDGTACLVLPAPVVPESAFNPPDDTDAPYMPPAVSRPAEPPYVPPPPATPRPVAPHAPYIAPTPPAEPQYRPQVPPPAVSRPVEPQHPPYVPPPPAAARPVEPHAPYIAPPPPAVSRPVEPQRPPYVPTPTAAARPVEPHAPYVAPTPPASRPAEPHAPHIRPTPAPVPPRLSEPRPPHGEAPSLSDLQGVWQDEPFAEPGLRQPSVAPTPPRAPAPPVREPDPVAAPGGRREPASLRTRSEPAFVAHPRAPIPGERIDPGFSGYGPAEPDANDEFQEDERDDDHGHDPHGPQGFREPHDARAPENLRAPQDARDPYAAYDTPFLRAGRPEFSPEADPDEPGFDPEPAYGMHGEARPRYDADEERMPFAEAPPAPRNLMAWLWALLCLLGLVLAALQAVYVYRNDIASRFPAMRPALAMGCERLHCDVAYERRIERISVMSSSLRPPPGPAADGHSKFVFRAVIRNRYDNPQPFPALVLELTDFSDTVVARKVLQPELYVPAAQRGKPFEAGADVSLEIPIDVTGLAVNGYQLDKFFP